MVSLTTILRISAEEKELRIRAATRPRRIREIAVLFMSRQRGRILRPHPSSTRIFLLLFVTRGRHFLFGLGRAGVLRTEAAPAGKIGAPGDQASAALVGEIRPRPLDKDEQEG